jgi:CheY-like chemotaxis protein
MEPAKDHEGLVLLVEDDPNHVLIIQRAFSKARITNPLHVCANGERAVTYLSDRENTPPSLILLDLRMPRIRGLKVLEWMRGKPELKDTPVVVLTSSIEPEDRRRADELGVVAYLCKPVNAEGLRELVDTVPQLHVAV